MTLTFHIMKKISLKSLKYFWIERIEEDAFESLLCFQNVKVFTLQGVLAFEHFN